MTRIFESPSNAEVHKDTRARLQTVEQRTPDPSTGRFCLTCVGTTGGSATLTSQPWRPWDGAVRLDLIMITLSSAATDVVTADVLVNGTSIGTATVAAGDTKGSAGVDGATVGPSDTLTVELSIASGSLAGGETVQMWFRGSGGGSLVLAGASGGGTFGPTMSLYGSQSIPDGFSDVGLSASSWRQSPGMNPFIEVSADNGYGAGNRVEVIDDCELLAVFYVDWQRGGTTGELFAGVTAEDVDGFSSFEMFNGSYQNTVFPSGTQHVGVGVSRVFRAVTGAIFDPHAFQSTGVSRTIAWKFSLVLLESTTEQFL